MSSLPSRGHHRPAGYERGGRARVGLPNPFTISDLSYVWIICDVYENDLDAVHVGEYADIHLNAYPNQGLQGSHR
jgi:membrane fusion protein, heavy metal efflux system